jgi:hypothetical protein
MATFQAPFQRDAISEVVPRALELSSLSKSSLLTGRRRIRVIPQTGQTYGASTGASVGMSKPTLANILLQDSAGLLDMQSVVLSMNVKVQAKTQGIANNAIAKTSAAYVGQNVNPYAASLGASCGLIDASSNTALSAADSAAPVADSIQTFDVIDLVDDDPLVTAVLDDFVWSVFRRIQISLNSQLVDDLDYCGRRTTTEVYQSASPAWYDTIGTVMGAWKLTQGEYIQPLIVAPASSALGGGKKLVGSFPVKSRVQAHQWAAYSHQLAIASSAPSTPMVNPTINSAGGAFNILTTPVANNGNFRITLPAAFTGTGYIGPWQVVVQTGDPAADLSGMVQYLGEVAGVQQWAGQFEVNQGPTAGGVLRVRAVNELIGVGVFPTNTLIFENLGTGGPVSVTSVLLFGSADPLVVPTIAMGTAQVAASQAAALPNTQTWLDGGVGALAKLGRSWTTPGPYRNAPVSVRPMCAAPDYTATVSRTDVLSKLYSTSAFMKDVFFQRGQPTVVPGACSNPPLLAAGLLDAVYLNDNSGSTPNAFWSSKTTPSDGPKFSVPLGLLSHLFRQEQLFPLRNAGQLIIQIQFADALECCYAGYLYPIAHAPNGTAVQDLSTFKAPGTVAIGYEVSNLELECDIVTAIPEYTAILDAICSRPADKGLAIAFDSHLTSLQQVSTQNVPKYGTASGSGQSQTFTLIASKGSENVRSFTWTFSPSAGLRSPYYMQNSTFPAYNINQWQLRVGSVYYPAFPSKGLSKNYMEMLSAINAPMPSIGQATLINYNMYRSSTPSYEFYAPQTNNVIDSANCANITPGSGALSVIESWRYDPKAGVFGQIRSATSDAGILLQDPSTSYMSDAYIGSYCFDNLKHAEALSHDGIDTRAIAGGMIQLDFTCEPLENFAVIFHIRFTRTIVLAENGVSIVG